MSTAAALDLRSDTLTKPSPAMRRAMADAEVGDDVLDGDPTTRRRAGVRVARYGPWRLRAVMHLDVSRADVERAARIIVETLR